MARRPRPRPVAREGRRAADSALAPPTSFARNTDRSKLAGLGAGKLRLRAAVDLPFVEICILLQH